MKINKNKIFSVFAQNIRTICLHIAIALLYYISFKQSNFICFKLLSIDSYFFFVSGIVSVLLLSTKTMLNDDIPRKGSLCLAFTIGCLVSVFFQSYPLSS